MSNRSIATLSRRPAGDHFIPEGVRPRSHESFMRRVAPYFARALLLRCPVCGGGQLFKSWFRMVPQCPSCGFALQREEGYFSGAMAVNLMACEFILTAILIALTIKTWPLALTWPSPPLQTAWYVSIVAAGILPILTYPLSKPLWVAFDLTFRPPTPADFRETIPTVR